ncbi:MAG: hypothetical protein JXA09_06305 [Anaerolineae bacterium]|nr:hypothetical protein [Anaerolineae bacterium]
MSERRILDMLESGVIGAEDAARLLRAVTDEPEAEGTPPDRAPTLDATTSPSEPDEALLGALHAQAARWKRLQWVPFAVSASVLMVASWALWEVHRAADGRITFGWVMLLLLALLSLGATAVSAWIVNAPWLHVRISGGDGKRLAISMPLPLGLLDWGVRIAGRFVGEDLSTTLGASAEMLHALRQTGDARQPVEVRVDEGDERVYVYIG